MVTSKTQVRLLNLPEGYRPSRYIMKTVSPYGSTGGINYIDIGASGDIKIYVENTDTRIIEFLKFSTL